MSLDKWLHATVIVQPIVQPDDGSDVVQLLHLSVLTNPD